ncbi:MAG TPA: CAAX prenyl protease-related protein [Patescibacteria group bacterium]|nr:CAAX prenyl protease-related protein [Patescibacteria group bacterium]
MQFLRKKFALSPERARIIPFAVFVVLTFAQVPVGQASVYVLYLIKTLVGAWLIWEMRPFVQEMRWAFSWEAVVIGILVCAIWIGLDGFYPRLAKPEVSWNPGPQHPNSAWLWNGVRLLGSSLVVPPLEEVFYRSFLYRYLVRINFLTMPLGQFHGLSFVVTSAIFGLMHPERWVAGILCGLAYQGLVVHKGRLGDAMTAHGITNFLLGVWVIWKHDWSFW